MVLAQKVAPSLLRLIGKKGYSGHFKHAGRLGLRGGSAPSGVFRPREKEALSILQKPEGERTAWAVDVIAKARPKLEAAVREHATLVYNRPVEDVDAVRLLGEALDAITVIKKNFDIPKFILSIMAKTEHAQILLRGPMPDIWIGTNADKTTASPKTLRERAAKIRDTASLPNFLREKAERLERTAESMESGKYDYAGMHSRYLFPPERQVEAIVTHELGHIVYEQNKQKVLDSLDSFRQEGMRHTPPTDRAWDDDREDFAESFTLYVSGHKYLLDEAMESTIDSLKKLEWRRL